MIIGVEKKPTAQQNYEHIEALIDAKYRKIVDGEVVKGIVSSADSYGVNLSDGKGYPVPLKNDQLVPSPFINSIEPASMQPSATKIITIKGSYLTPTTTVTIPGQTVSDFKFISDNEITVKVTTAATQADFDVTVNNGSSTTITRGFLVTLGEVIIPKSSDFNLVTGSQELDLTNDGIVKLKTDNTPGAVRFFNVPLGQDFQLRWRAHRSLVSTVHDTNQQYDVVNLLENNQLRFKVAYSGEATGIIAHPGSHAYGGITYGDEIMLERIGETVKLYVKGEFKMTLPALSNTGSIVFQINLHRLDIGDIIYIKL